MTVLSTDRLTLRRHVLSDWPAYRDFYASEATVHVGGPRDAKAAWSLFAADAGHWDLHGFGWFILDDGSGPVGTCGLHHPPHQPQVEIGWTTFADARGKGYAPEAARAVLAWAPKVLGDAPVVSYIATANGASKRVAEKLGARWEGEMAAHDTDAEIWRHAPGGGTAKTDGGAAR